MKSIKFADKYVIATGGNFITDGADHYPYISIYDYSTNTHKGITDNTQG